MPEAYPVSSRLSDEEWSKINLSFRQRELVKLRYLTPLDQRLSLAAIASKHRVTIGRVRYILKRVEQKACDTLRTGVKNG